jgi:hypothetical protein
MSLLLITFNISDQSKKEACRGYILTQEHIEISDCTFIVKSTQILEFWRKELAEFMQGDDKLFISVIEGKSWISYRLGRNRRTWTENV